MLLDLPLDIPHFCPVLDDRKKQRLGQCVPLCTCETFHQNSILLITGFSHCNTLLKWNCDIAYRWTLNVFPHVLDHHKKCCNCGEHLQRKIHLLFSSFLDCEIEKLSNRFGIRWTFYRDDETVVESEDATDGESGWKPLNIQTEHLHLRTRKLRIGYTVVVILR